MTWIDSFLDDYLGPREGTVTHTGQEGKTTYAYGILKSTAKKYPKKEGETDKEWASRVVGEYEKKVKDQVGKDTWTALPDSIKKWAVDMKWNTGLSTQMVNRLKNGQYKDALKAGLEYVTFKDAKNKRYASSGLAQRTASRYNLGMEGLESPSYINSYSAKKKDNSVDYNFYDDAGNDVKSFNKAFPMASSSTEKTKEAVSFIPQPVIPSPPPDYTPQAAADVQYNNMEELMASRGVNISNQDALNAMHQVNSLMRNPLMR